MNNIPTAEELMEHHVYWDGDDRGFILTSESTKKLMIEFAKLHVKSALELAAKYSDMYIIDKESILNVYPENLIK